jgi:NAD(P)-dependent dehydrogenase (short-subunit alcohol dehydrogenase family)
VLRGGLATIDIDDLAGDERRPVRGHKQDRVGDLFRPAGTIKRDPGDKACLPVGTAGEAIEHRRLDRAGRYHTAESYAATFDTNVLNVLLSMKHELRVMQAQRAGSIINLSSTMGHRGAPNASLYVASKHGRRTDQVGGP